jgi:predicted metal-dependent hydrolase
LTPTRAEEAGSVKIEGRPIAFTIIRSRRRHRTFEIRLDRERGVLISVPWRTPTERAIEHVKNRAEWILRRSASLAPAPGPADLAQGGTLPYLGTQLALTVESAAVRKASVSFDLSEGTPRLRVLVPVGLDESSRQLTFAIAIERWYRRRAFEAMTESVAFWAPAVGASPTRIVVRDQKHLWGSCGPDGTIRFNWRLIQLDPGLIDYVVVHELSHLKVRNHSSRFWAEVGRVQPDYAARRQRLREEGARVVL